MIGAVPIHVAHPRRPHAVPIPLIDFTPPRTRSSGTYDEELRVMLKDFLSRLASFSPMNWFNKPVASTAPSLPT